ncbi:protein PHYLLO [Abeliophyllum distichum]|uniref:Protein PHYLLO n=1 Tax=Abeliophyllum distichum TaxID=126358 RepID=A0ABD1REC3_9LAMI
MREDKVVDVKDVALLVSTCITRNLPPALTLDQGLDKIKEVVEELKAKPPSCSSGIQKLSSLSATSWNGFAYAEYDDGGYGYNHGYHRARGQAKGTIFVVVRWKDTTVRRWKLGTTVKATIKNHPFKVVAMRGELAAWVMDAHLIGQSMLLELLRYSNLEQRGHNIM